jgi:hypothetical protein
VLIEVGCASLPSKEKVTRLYERQYPDRHVSSVEEKKYPPPGTIHESQQVWFEIFYFTASESALKTDVWKYHPVAEGMVRIYE